MNSTWVIPGLSLINISSLINKDPSEGFLKTEKLELVTNGFMNSFFPGLNIWISVNLVTGTERPSADSQIRT